MPQWKLMMEPPIHYIIWEATNSHDPRCQQCPPLPRFPSDSEESPPNMVPKSLAKQHSFLQLVGGTVRDPLPNKQEDAMKLKQPLIQ